MPVLSMFFGIIVRMYREESGKHNMPHLHAEYSGEEIVMALDGTIWKGKRLFQEISGRCWRSGWRYIVRILKRTGSCYPMASSSSALIL
jgi:hypothetical protein